MPWLSRKKAVTPAMRAMMMATTRKQARKYRHAFFTEPPRPTMCKYKCCKAEVEGLGKGKLGLKGLGLVHSHV